MELCFEKTELCFIISPRKPWFFETEVCLSAFFPFWIFKELSSIQDLPSPDSQGLGAACPGTWHLWGHWGQTPTLHPLPFPTKSSLSTEDWLTGPCFRTWCIRDLIFSRKEQNFAWCSRVFKHARVFAEHAWLQVSKFLIFWRENQQIMTVLEK